MIRRKDIQIQMIQIFYKQKYIFKVYLLYEIYKNLLNTIHS